MGLEQRPYIGSWRLGTQKVVQMTPDALVYINGDLALPGCPRCSGKIDFQQFVTEVSVDAGANPEGASAGFTLSIPVHHNESFARDAQYILRPGLEVHIYERGYFAVKGLYSNLDQPQNLQDRANPENTEVVSGFLTTSAEASPVSGDQLGKSADDINQAQIPSELLLKWQSRGLSYPSGVQGQNAAILAGCLEVVEGIWQEVYPGAVVGIGSALRLGDEDGGNHQQGGAADINVSYKDANGNTQRVPARLVWASLQQAADNGLIPSGGFGLYVNPDGTPFANVHYDFRGYFGFRPGDSPKGWVRLDTNGDGKADLSTEHSSPWKADALQWLTDNGYADLANWYAGDWRTDPFIQRLTVDGQPNVFDALGQTITPEEAVTQAGEASGTPDFSKSALQNAGVSGMDIENILAYPYYLVFHGVISAVTVSYSGGVQTVTVQCSSMLHFWEYQRMSTNASLFGAKPRNSGNKMSLEGHNYTGMHPYEIIYSLHQDVAGAAAGVSWALAQKTNLDAQSSVLNESFYSLNLRYWEKRFHGRQIRLRMHGADGRLFNAAQAAYLGSVSSNELTRLLKNRFKQGAAGKNKVGSRSKSMHLGEPQVLDSLTLLDAGVSQDSGAAFEINMAEIQAFVLDIGNMGQIGLFESTYSSKLDIASEVCTKTGFEFYQDVDGDFVFKPPMYNLDTSSSRIYCIEDIDIISITFNESEPQATYITGKNGAIGNMVVSGLEGEWGVQGHYVDYRLVAQFGWRPADFETSYLADKKGLFFAAANRLDILNIGMHSGSITVPLRPELRPGYPVYIRCMDCFYYCSSFAHSFSVGGQCTTSLEIAGRRAKFYAPGNPSASGIEAIDLGNMTLPQRPLEVLDMAGQPRLAGFPNVVMALDPQKINPMFFLVGADLGDITNEETLNSLLKIAVDLNILTKSDEDSNIYHWAEGATQETNFYFASQEVGAVSQTGNKPKNTVDLRDAAENYKAALAANTEKKWNKLTQTQQDAFSLIQSLIQKVGAEYIQRQAGTGDALGDVNSSASLLAMLSDKKAIFTNGSLPGSYRYYSASHPDPTQQGQTEFSLNLRDDMAGKALSEKNPYLDPKYKTETVPMFAPLAKKTFPVGAVEPEAQVIEGVPVQGICVFTSNPEAPNGEIIPTSEVMELMFARHVVAANKKSTSTKSIPDFTDDSSLKEKWVKEAVEAAMTNEALGKTGTIQEIFSEWYAAAKVQVDEAVNWARWTEAELFPDVASKVPGFVFPIFPSSVTFRGAGVDATKPFGNGSYRFADVNEPPDAPELFRGSSKYLLSSVWMDIGVLLGRQTSLRVLAEAAQVWVPALVSAYKFADRGKAHEIVSAFYEALSSRQGGKAIQQNGKKIPKSHEISSPVFPISDAAGYEVIGSFRYGRGLDIDPDGVFDALHRQDPLQMLDKRTVDNIVRVLMHGGKITIPGKEIPGRKTATGAPVYDKPRQIGGLEARNVIEQDVITQLRSRYTDKQILDLGLAMQTGDPNVLQINLSNWLAEKGRDGIQKLPLNNAAYSLADLTGHTTQSICSCKMAEAEVILEAAGQDGFVKFAEPGVLVPSGITNETQDRPTQWAISMAAQSSMGWKVSQDALRGTTQEQKGSSIVQAVSAFGVDETARKLDELEAGRQGLLQMGDSLAALASRIGEEET